jgi:cellulose synthase/poly-beta-1,6-N-acetylglucosamine synthase-like glycosyltransferase
VVIPAYREGEKIRQKLENTLALVYPAERREIIVAVDGADPATMRAAEPYADRGVKLIPVPERRGKHYAQMVARDASQGDILVFTDASIRLEPDALQRITSSFADPSVGCVSSEDRVVTENRRVTGEKDYIAFDMWLRRLESRVGSPVGASGAFFAARKEVCDVWFPAFSSDFFIPLRTVSRGMRAIVDPECRCYYGVVASDQAEFQRKVRTIVHGLDAFFAHLKLLNPLRHGLFAVQFASHKVFRWLVPFVLIALLVSSAFLWRDGGIYRLALVLQLALYGAGAVALAFPPLGRVGFFRIAGFFLLVNAATLTAWIQYFAGEKYATWQPSQRD